MLNEAKVVFPSPDNSYREEILLKIEQEEYNNILDNLEELEDSDYLIIAEQLIQAGQGWLLVNNFEKFKNLDYQLIAEQLIQAGQGNVVAHRLGKFENLEYQLIAEQLIQAGEIKLLAYNLAKFNGLDQSIAEQLIQVNEGWVVADNLKKFKDLNYPAIAEQLIQAGQGNAVACFLKNFEGLDHAAIAEQLIQAGLGKSVTLYLKQFNNLNSFHIYQALKDQANEFFNEVEETIPGLAERLSLSTSLALDLYSQKEQWPQIRQLANDRPELLQVFANNPRYGVKLLLKYPQFNPQIQKKIDHLISTEQTIKQDYPEIDIHSLGFRQLMQNELLPKDNNLLIVKELGKQGVNTIEWLNYDRPIYFTLGQEEEVKFSDQVQLPINRIKETLTVYQESLTSRLVEYKEELSQATISDPKDQKIRDRIEQLKELIAQEVDEQKKAGMTKGLIGLESKLSKSKPIKLWDRLQGDLSRLQLMINNVFKVHDQCLATEEQLATITNRSELVKTKQELQKQITQFKNDLDKFEHFFDNYETNLIELLVPVLGDLRTEALLQASRETIGEELHHYQVDQQSLRQILTDQHSSSDGLKGHEMKIDIASRSTQDLYLGNYCPCCICIESNLHGVNSPIVDYVTDLGMQNIVVYDQTIDEPVVACWAFIGQNELDGPPILVIDNIEANTNYTNNYPQQLIEQIEKFVTDYAQAIGVQEIVQGPKENKLEVFLLDKINKKLKDLYNGPEKYYLEALGAYIQT